MGDDDLFSVLSDLSSIEADPPEIRSACDRCRRPISSCWCRFLPEQPLSIQTHVYILQHPFEETRNLQTAPMLTLGLQEGHCRIIKGKKFALKRLPELDQILPQPNTILLFPGRDAVDMNEFLEQQKSAGFDGSYNLVVLDGTWHQARGIYCQNQFLHSLRKVQFSNSGLSKYVIRTQPTDSGLSTVETVAMAIGQLEHRPEVYQILTRPLDALCDHQLKHGAVRHHSKQYLVENGLYVKPKSHLVGLKRKEEKLQAKQKGLPLAVYTPCLDNTNQSNEQGVSEFEENAVDRTDR